MKLTRNWNQELNLHTLHDDFFCICIKKKLFLELLTPPKTLFQMKIHSNVKLYNLLRSLSILKHKSRQEFCVKIIEGLILSRSVTFSDIAEHIDKDIKTSSINRMLQNFF